MHDCFPDIPEKEKWTETIIFDRETDELVYPTLIDQAKNKQANKNQPLNHPEGAHRILLYVFKAGEKKTLTFVPSNDAANVSSVEGCPQCCIYLNNLKIHLHS